MRHDSLALLRRQNEVAGAKRRDSKQSVHDAGLESLVVCFGRGALDAAADGAGDCGLRGCGAGVCAAGGGVVGAGGLLCKVSGWR